MRKGAKAAQPGGHLTETIEEIKKRLFPNPGAAPDPYDGPSADASTTLVSLIRLLEGLDEFERTRVLRAACAFFNYEDPDR